MDFFRDKVVCGPSFSSSGTFKLAFLRTAWRYAVTYNILSSAWKRGVIWKDSWRGPYLAWRCFSFLKVRISATQRDKVVSQRAREDDLISARAWRRSHLSTRVRKVISPSPYAVIISVTCDISSSILPRHGIEFSNPYLSLCLSLSLPPSRSLFF